MIKQIIQIADVHLRCIQRMEEYTEQLTKLIDKIQEITRPFKKEEVRIAICGDLLHQKNSLSPELIVFASSFIRQLEEFGKVIVIAGNHDLIVNNQSRKDALTAIFETASFENSFFLDYELEFQSGYVIDENITWAVYSIYNDFMRPNIEQAKGEAPENKVIGLYHGMIVGAQLNNGQIVDSGVDRGLFQGCDFVLAGDIHKRQVLKKGKVEIVYPGSLIQQTFGETITQHGFAVWNVETNEHQFVDLESDYGLYDMEINSFEDIDMDKERLINY